MEETTGNIETIIPYIATIIFIVVSVMMHNAKKIRDKKTKIYWEEYRKRIK